MEEGQIIKKQGAIDERSTSREALLKECAEFYVRLELQEKGFQE